MLQMNEERSILINGNLMNVESLLTPKKDPNSSEPIKPKPKSKIRRECDLFLSWRWKWLVGIYIIFFVPLVALVPHKFVLWFCLNVAGFIYVAGATESRSNPLLSRKEEDGQLEIVKLIIATPAVYYLGAHWTLLDGSTNFEDIVLFEGFGKRIITSGFLSFYLYNYFCYVTPFFIGIHFTYLDYFPFLQKIVINKAGLKKLMIYHWVLLSVGSIIVVALLIYQVYLYYLHNYLLPFGIGLGVFIILLLVAAYIEMKYYKKYFHLHHFQIGFLILVFTANQNVISAILQGISAGIYVEGVARWSMSSSFSS